MKKIVKVSLRDKMNGQRKRLEQQIKAEMLLESVEQSRASHIGSRRSHYTNRGPDYVY
jgi:hypothetical protein